MLGPLMQNWLDNVLEAVRGSPDEPVLAAAAIKGRAFQSVEVHWRGRWSAAKLEIASVFRVREPG